MRPGLLLVHPVTLLILQQVVLIWFLVDFFLARDSTAANKLFSERVSRVETNNVLNRIETATKDLKTKQCNSSNNNRADFDKVILIVIDALGSEFLPSLSSNHYVKHNSTRMPFIEEALGRGEAMGFVATAATPTVTMPRVKALVSGTIPSFMDIVYNLANDVSDFHDENILSLAKSMGKSLVFYGDDTWLSLFDKSMFTRLRATLSLYAADFTSVDTNVTEMAVPETELDSIDWDYLILHYLGLDHIGHVFGSNQAPLIEKKLIEMDDVIREMHQNMMTKKDLKTLVIICGDHGMSPEGNHGGDTRLEVETAMIFMPINRPLTASKNVQQDKKVYQIDMAATLSVLAGLPIPKMSRGVLIESLLMNLWHNNDEKLLCTAADNLVQLSSLLDSTELDSPDGLGQRILETLSKPNGEIAPSKLIQLARDVQAHLLKTAAAKSNPLLVMIAVSFVMLLSLINMRKSSIRLLMPLMNVKEKIICATALLLPILMQNSTDFIESENTFWPFFSMGIFLAFCMATLRSTQLNLIKSDIDWFRLGTFALTFLVITTWNNLGLHRSLEMGWSLPVISVLSMCNFSRRNSKIEGKQSAIFYAMGLCVFVTKMVEETSEVQENQFSQVAILQVCSLLVLTVATCANLFESFRKNDHQETSIVQKLATSWMWYMFLLTRSRNYVFLVSNVIMEASLNSVSNSMRFTPITRALVYLQFATNAFYAQGNSNLFSSLDVKPAFFGQTTYNFLLAVPLIACATCGTQIYWYLKLFQRVQGEKEQERMQRTASSSLDLDPRVVDGSKSPSSLGELIPEGTKRAVKDFIDMRNFLTLGYFMFVCIVLRNHLFIWSVISPKLVYIVVTNLILRVTTSMISLTPPLVVRLLEYTQGGGGGGAYKRVVD